MKAIKISLSAIFIIAIIFWVYNWYESLIPPNLPETAKNQFIIKIENEIYELSQKPENEFCKEYYTEINYHLDNFHETGKLGQNQTENEQWKDILGRRLYSTYADKFINQAFYVFNNPNWEFKDLTFIRKEYQLIKNSSMLLANSPVDQKLSEISRIFAKHDEIVGFISISKNFSFSDTDLTSRFPIAEVKKKISQVKSYQINRLGNVYVNNCIRLHNDLNNILEHLFRAHTRYLDNKIDAWSSMYSNYNSQKAYGDNLYAQLDSEIEELDNDIYKSSNFNMEYIRLKRKWQEDARKAYAHFNQ